MTDNWDMILLFTRQLNESLRSYNYVVMHVPVLVAREKQ